MFKLLFFLQEIQDISPRNIFPLEFFSHEVLVKRALSVEGACTKRTLSMERGGNLDEAWTKSSQSLHVGVHEVCREHARMVQRAFTERCMYYCHVNYLE